MYRHNNSMDRKIEKKKWTPKNISIITSVGGFALFALYSFLFGFNESRLNIETNKISISAVTVGGFQEFIPVTGRVNPIRTVYLDVIEGGKVDSLFVEAGSFVEKGQKILRLSNSNLMLDMLNREAQLFEQINNLRNTRLALEQNRLNLRQQLLDLDYQIVTLKHRYDRNEIMYKKGLLSQEEYDAVNDEYDYLLKKRVLTFESHKQDSVLRLVQVDQLQSSVARMQNSLKMVKLNLDNLAIKAPISGQLTSLNAELGESKSRGQRLGQIDVLDGFKVTVDIDEFYLSRIDLGQHGKFRFADITYRLSIMKIYPEIENTRFEVDMKFLEAEPEGIRRGQSVRIRLELGDLTNAMLLPRGGFYQETGGRWVYVLNESGDFAVKRDVKLGRQNTEVYEVLSGLKEGERIITSSYRNFGDVERLVLKD